MIFQKIEFVVNFLDGERLKISTNTATYLRDRKKGPVVMDIVKREVPTITKLVEEEIKDA